MLQMSSRAMCIVIVCWMFCQSMINRRRAVCLDSNFDTELPLLNCCSSHCLLFHSSLTSVNLTHLCLSKTLTITIFVKNQRQNVLTRYAHAHDDEWNVYVMQNVEEVQQQEEGGRGEQSSLFATCPETEPASKFHSPAELCSVQRGAIQQKCVRYSTHCSCCTAATYIKATYLETQPTSKFHSTTPRHNAMEAAGCSSAMQFNKIHDARILQCTVDRPKPTY